MRTIQIKNELYNIEKWEEKINRKNLKYGANKYTYDFQQYDTTRYFCDNIYTTKLV